MRREAVVGVIAILVIASFGAGYLAGSGVRQTGTRTVTSTTAVAKTAASVATSTAGTGRPIQAADVEAANISLRDLNGIAVDANASRVYAERFNSVSMNYSLTVIDASSNTVVANVSLPSIVHNPEGGSFCSDLAVDDSAGIVYVVFTGTASA